MRLIVLTEAGKVPAESYVSVTRIMLPTDANAMGNVFGGTILGLIEETAWLAAIRHARCNLVTASIDRMDFLAPAYIGDILRFKASVNYVHKTSMEVGVRVEAEKPSTGEIRHTGTCFLTYVALGKDGKPMTIPTLLPETEEEKRRWDEGQQRQRSRLREVGKLVD